LISEGSIIMAKIGVDIIRAKVPGEGLGVLVVKIGE